MRVEIETKFNIGDMVFVKSDVYDLKKKSLQIFAISVTHSSIYGVFGISNHHKIEYDLALFGNEYIGFELITKNQDELVSEQEGIKLRKSIVNGGWE